MLAIGLERRVLETLRLFLGFVTTKLINFVLFGGAARGRKTCFPVIPRERDLAVWRQRKFTQTIRQSGATVGLGVYGSTNNATFNVTKGSGAIDLNVRYFLVFRQDIDNPANQADLQWAAGQAVK